MINQIKLPSAQLLNAENNKPLSTTVKYICTESQSELYPKDIGTYLPLGNTKVEFTKEEMNAIKTFGEPSLVLIGFKPKDRLKIYHNVKAPYFLYPDDERVENSSKFFDGLIETMINKKKIAIARFIPKNKSKVRFVALVPQKESYDPEDDSHIPGGLNLIFLPFAEEIRDTKNLEEVTEIQNELTEPLKNQVNVAKKMINALTIDFSPHSFENQSLQKMHSYLQALALGETEPEPVKDTLLPDFEGMKAVQPMVDLFKKAIWGDDYVDPEVRANEEDKKGKGLGKGRKNEDEPAEDIEPKPIKKAKKKKEDDEDFEEKPQSKKDEESAAPKTRKPRGKKTQDQTQQEEEIIEPSVAKGSRSKASTNKAGNPMDIEKSQAPIIKEEDDESDDMDVLQKPKGKKKTFTKK